MIKYVLPIKSELLTAELFVLNQQLGVTELTGNNDGKEISEYLSSVGLGVGYPYCYAGLYFCFNKACIIAGVPKTENPIVKTGSTVLGYNLMIKKGVEQIPAMPAVGDLIFWKYKDKSSGHVEQIIDVLSATEIITIGFNTSPDKRFTTTENERNGSGVYKKYRKLSGIGKMFLRGLIGFKRI